MIIVSPTLSIDDGEIVETFDKASGSVGQKVTKTLSAVKLRFDARCSPSLSDAVAIRRLGRSHWHAETMRLTSDRRCDAKI